MQSFIGLIQTMRPKQWTKNVLFVFPGIIFDGKLFQIDALMNVLTACVLLILVSGSVYIINDLVDIERDRQHPQKRSRPLPSGQLSPHVARLAALLIPIGAILFALFFRPMLALVLALYLVLQVAYSFGLKHVVIIDVLAVTAGFVLRITAGVAVIQVENFSPWLFACGGLLALFLIVGKRRQELQVMGGSAGDVRPVFLHYNLPLLDDMLQIVITSTLITYILYTIEAPTRKLADANLALLTVPVVIYGLFRYLYLIRVRGEGSAPDEVLLKDRLLQVTILVWGGMFVILLYLIPG